MPNRLPSDGTYCLPGLRRWLLAFVCLWKTTSVCCLETTLPILFDGKGVTSLHAWNESIIIAGTKAGRIYFKANGLLSSDNKQGVWNEMVGYASKYPIYSLSSSSSMPLTSCDNLPSEERCLLFGGGGDRWISVWENAVYEEDGPEFHFIQRLGPHTGWVKDLVYDNDLGQLHSIGCNCIESWDCKISPIQHISKRLIESSPTMGSTLSSDLLCLCIVPGSGLLAAGGVDGRIHLWLSDPRSTKQILCSVVAHEGRVNSLKFSPLLRTLFSVGHDGSIHAYKVSAANRLELISKLDLKMKDREFRLTTALILNEFQREDDWYVCNLAVGSAGGKIGYVTAEMDSNCSRLMLRMDGHATVGEYPPIYAIAAQTSSDVVSTPRLYIGHAMGLGTVDLSHC